MPEIQSNQRTLEQQRAAQAWEYVSELKNRSVAEKYGKLARSAAADIQVNGLGQTLAFWKAKKEEHHLKLFEHVSAWVTGQLKVNGDLLIWITKTATTDEYRRATAETIAFLAWVKRFAEAELDEK
jgi:CRISPR-associated protein Cmr5